MSHAGIGGESIEHVHRERQTRKSAEWHALCCTATESRGPRLTLGTPRRRYIFPGLALGASLGRTKLITDHMVMAAAEALPKMLTADERRRRAVYPDLAHIRRISAHMAVEVIKAAAEDDMVHGPAAAKLGKGDDALRRWVHKHMYSPEYRSIVSLPVGVAE